jgi:hypothetical protein
MDLSIPLRFSRALHAGPERHPPDDIGGAVRLPCKPAAYPGVALGVGITAGLTGFGIGAILAGAAGPAGHSGGPGGGLDRLDGGAALARAAPAGRQRERTRHGVSCAPSCSNGSTRRSGPSRWRRHRATASGSRRWEEAQRLAFAFSGINLFVCLFWAFAGSLLSTLLTDDRAWTIFTRVMATGLAVSAVMVFV